MTSFFSRHYVMLSLLISVALAHPTAMLAQSEAADSTTVNNDGFKPQQLILPTALIAVGAFGVHNGWFCGLKQDVKESFYDLRGDCTFKLDNTLQYLPLAASVGLGLVGVKAKHPFRERIAATATATLAMVALTNGMKHTIREKRPDSDARNSFPSGHTATAFLGAELVRIEYGNGWGAGAYAVATGIAFLRLYNDRHWLNDIIGGAGVGILSAKIGYWLLPLEKRLFGWDKSKRTMVVIPTYNAYDKSVGVAFAANF